MRLLRIFGMLLGMLFAVGFGLCGAYGIVAGVNVVSAGSANAWSLLLLACGLVGLGICAACVLLVRRSLKGKPGIDQAPAP